MNETLTFENYQPQNIIIGGGGSVIGLTTVLVNGVDVTEGSVAYVVVPTKLSELVNDTGFINHEVDPTVPYHVKQISLADINKWNNKQDLLVSGTNIKTINNESILGSGNIEIEETPYTAGIGIEIQNHVINNTITSYNDLTDLPTIPTKTSELNNDSNYVTSSELSDVAFSGSYLDLSNTPSNLSEFTNDEGFITDETNTLQNYMLSEYLDSILPKVTDSGTDITLDNTAKAPMKIELSPSEMEQEDTPTPDNPQPIHTTTGDNVIKVEGSNLIEDTIQNANIGSTGIIASPSEYNLQIAKVVQGENYIISNIDMSGGYQLVIGYFNTKPSDGDSTYNNSRTITYNTTITAEITGYIAIRTKNTETKPMLNKGTTALPYEPYTLDTYPLTLGTLEYSKIGNYEDEFIYNTTDTNLELNKWYLKKNTLKKIFTGASSEGWSLSSLSATNVERFYIDLTNDEATVQTLATSSLFNLLPYGGGNNDNEHFRFGVSSGTLYNRLLIYINKNRLSSVNATGLKSYLSTNNLIGCWATATPRYIPLNDTLQTQLTNIYNNMISKKGQTNISQTNQDIGFNITATAFAKIGGLS